MNSFDWFVWRWRVLGRRYNPQAEADMAQLMTAWRKAIVNSHQLIENVLRLLQIVKVLGLVAAMKFERFAAN